MTAAAHGGNAAKRPLLSPYRPGLHSRRDPATPPKWEDLQADRPVAGSRDRESAAIGDRLELGACGPTCRGGNGAANLVKASARTQFRSPPNPFQVEVTVTMTNNAGETATGTVVYTTDW